MIQINDIRKLDAKVIFLGSHPGIIQSIIDYDYLIGKLKPSVIAVIAGGRKQERYFWGESEVTIPVYESISKLRGSMAEECNMVVNVQSARRVLRSTKQALELIPNLQVINIFAEQTPELHTLEISRICKGRDIIVAGPSSVGVLIPGCVKLGAIGGTQHPQISAAKITSKGDTAVVSTSGGMVNELIHTVTGSGHRVSFAVALGGDLYPVTSPADAFLLAEADESTKRIVYFGELGGIDEYEIAELIKNGKITKEIFAYIAGTVAELFESPPQFGHAKAIAKTYNESAKAKKEALKEVGVKVCETFSDLPKLLKEQSVMQEENSEDKKIGARKKAMFISHISGTKDDDVQLLGGGLLETTQGQSLASLVLSMLLGKQVESQKAIDFTDCILKLLVDHGPHVSGAVNVMISARAGKDLVSSLASGLLTVGPRFGGAINDAAKGWIDGVEKELSGKDFVDTYKVNGGIIPGIGHKKYRIDMPDPRIEVLAKFGGNSNGDAHFNFARSVEEVTATKKGNLILNVDGAIAAMMLDILQSELGYDTEQLKELAEVEFFNALFVLSRSIGFTAHYIDQRRHDEGLFRLPGDELSYIS